MHIEQIRAAIDKNKPILVRILIFDPLSRIACMLFRQVVHSQVSRKNLLQERPVLVQEKERSSSEPDARLDLLSLRKNKLQPTRQHQEIISQYAHFARLIQDDHQRLQRFIPNCHQSYRLEHVCAEFSRVNKITPRRITAIYIQN